LNPSRVTACPVWFGTLGERAVRVTGRHAGGWILSLGCVPEDDLLAMRGRVLAAGEDTGPGLRLRAQPAGPDRRSA
jgi:hypothetical protein